MPADNTAICEIAGGHRPPLQWPYSTFWCKAHRSISEHEFQPKLNLAGTRDCARDLARRGTDALTRKDKEVRNTEVCLVCDVEGFSPEEQAGSFRDWDGLENRGIDLRQARPVQHSAAHNSPGS